MTPRSARRPERERVPLQPDLRAAVPDGQYDANGVRVHHAGGLPPMPIRELPPPPDDRREWAMRGFPGRGRSGSS